MRGTKLILDSQLPGHGLIFRKSNAASARRIRLGAVLLAVAFSTMCLWGGAAGGEEASKKRPVAQRLLRAGGEAARLGRYLEADQAFRGAMAACRSEGDDECLWQALSSLTPVAQTLGWLDEAGEFAQEAAALAHRIRDRRAQGESYLLLASVLAEGGQAGEAEGAARRAMAVAEEMGSSELEAKALAVRGGLELARGNAEEACKTFKASLDSAPGAGTTPLRLRAQRGLGRCLLALGDHEGADAAFEEAFTEAVSLGDELSVAELFRQEGLLEAARGRPHRAEELLVEALRKFRSLEASGYAARAARELEKIRSKAGLPTDEERAERAAEATLAGLERLEAGNLEAAVRELEEAASLAPYDPEPHLVLARAYRALGLLELAEKEDRYASAVSENSSSFDLASENPRYQDYFARARRQIDRVYVIPEEVSRGEVKGFVRVAFTLESSGRLRKASVESTSGPKALEKAALSTLRLAEPFEPFPDGVDQDLLTIVARFVYDQDLAERPPSAEAEDGADMDRPPASR